MATLDEVLHYAEAMKPGGVATMVAADDVILLAAAIRSRDAEIARLRAEVERLKPAAQLSFARNPQHYTQMVVAASKHGLTILPSPTNIVHPPASGAHALRPSDTEEECP